jgi:glycosyltransferase involved in cell wall biosynthesis
MNTVMTSVQPLVSVVIPAFNAARFLTGSIPSVLAQTWNDFELIVVNDGSTDSTADCVRTFADPRIRLVTQANRGLAGARNAGIRAARGTYIAFLDADDLWHPEKLARHVQHLQSRPGVGVSYSASALMDDLGRDMHLMQSPKLSSVTARDVFLRNPVGNGSAPVIRRQTLDDIAFAEPTGASGERWYFDERFRQSEDIECWLRIALSTSWRFEGLAQPLTRYRVNAGGLSAALDKQHATWEAAVVKARAINPAFVAEHEHAARAYQLRYLARRALSMGESQRGWRLVRQALKMHPGMWPEEPARTAITLAAAIAMRCLPGNAYSGLSGLASRAVGWLQRRPRLA